jgi:hypothetical protein
MLVGHPLTTANDFILHHGNMGSRPTKGGEAEAEK